ncbi:hypothetical protein FSP39_016095 [Pinctada imbricata]|uniref:Uncharacterized protein n=1 Tax=Pinctada imbricata TaxID=66713 RepID=A0AA88XZ87_PINIB|nr:hypothetical protein FSP39_016095 [Pinctada imbricata]
MASTSKKQKVDSSDWGSLLNWMTSKSTVFPAFMILQLGPDCNAHMSVPFTEAKCNFKKLGVNKARLYLLDFYDIFSSGFDLLSTLKNKTRELNVDEQRAVDVLDGFLREREKHERSLHRILQNWKTKDKSGKKKDCTLAVALSEHLLGNLAPGHSFVIDKRTRGKTKKCKCGMEDCKAKPVFRDTGIGDERAWHGFIDILFSSHPVGVLAADHHSHKGEETEDEKSYISESSSSDWLSDGDSSDSDSDNEQDFHGVKTLCDVAAENQVIAQTIVFSYIQKKRHPDFRNFLIPNLLITPYHFTVLMYDSKNDILISSAPIPFFVDNNKAEELRITSIVFLWMVLHYRTFCEGIDVEEIIKNQTIKDVREIQSKFQERAREKFPFYEESASKIEIAKFTPTPVERLPTAGDFLSGCYLYGKRFV